MFYCPTIYPILIQLTDGTSGLSHSMHSSPFPKTDSENRTEPNRFGLWSWFVFLSLPTQFSSIATPLGKVKIITEDENEPSERENQQV